MRTCVECGYWCRESTARQKAGRLLGRCHRFPPIFNSDGKYSVWDHPLVLSDNWCGEFRVFGKPEQ